jgi:hypothetical protein
VAYFLAERAVFSIGREAGQKDSITVPIIAKASGDSSSFTPAPEGVHQAVCVDVIDKGLIKSTFLDKAGNPKMQHKIAIAWQIDELRDDGKRFVIYKRYTLSLNEKATLRKDLESWRGKAFTRDEEMGFDVETIKGANCLLNLQHHTVGEKTYTNVMSVMPLMRNMAKIAPLNYVRAVEGQSNGETETSPAAHDDDPMPGEPVQELTDDDIPF